MKMKRFLSVTLAFVIVLGTIQWIAIEGEASSNIIINGVDIEYAVGDYFTYNGYSCGSCHGRYTCPSNPSDCNCIRYWPSKSTQSVDLAAVQCYGFAHYCQWAIYGSYSVVSDITGDVTASACTESNIKTLLNGCAPATHIRVGTGDGSHSLVVVSTSDSNISIVECNVEDTCQITSETYTWADFAAYLKRKNGITFTNECMYGVDTRYSGTLPITKYTLSSSNVTAYSSVQGNSCGSIYPDDPCVIESIFTNGWCKVKCPWTLNGVNYTRTVFVPLSVFGDIELIPDVPVDLGDDFSAPILNKEHWKIIENNNGVVQTANETGTSNQLWKFERQSDGSYKISSCFDGRCLDVADASSDPEAKIWVVDSNDSDAQRWYIYEESGGYILRAKCTNCVLDLTNNDPTNGNQLQMYTQNGTGAQIWAIYDGDECKLTAPTLSVTPGNTTTQTTFTWNNVYGETRYHVKIWKATALDGDAYHVEWDASSGWGIQLPAGTYQAYVDAGNYYETRSSNIVTFTVEDSEYVVSYNANGGIGAPSMQTKQHGIDLTLSTTLPEYFPYNFMGWESSQGKSYEPGGIYTKNESTEMTAEWDFPDRLEMDYHDGYGLNSAPILWGGYSWTYHFTPEVSTYYRFVGHDDVDTMIVLRDADGNVIASDDDSGGNWQFELEYYLEADTLYFITVKKYSSSQTGNINFVTLCGFNVTYDANGGKNAPAPARWYIDEGYMLSHDMPTRVGYTFLGWSLEADATEPEFYPGEDFDIPMDVTLYAVWSPLPYLFYGDLNQDRTVTLTDVNIISKYLNGTYTPAYDAKEFLLRADLDHNGVITENDKKLINDLKLAQLTQEEIEAGCIDVRISALPETEYVLGQEYDTDGLTLLLDFGTHAYPITEDLSVSGYNPGALGEQKITVTFYQYSASYTITVHPEEAPILYGDVNGDGNVNTKDRMVLTRYLAGMTGYTADMIDMKSADVNCDGTVNAKDRMILTRYLAQWTAYPELPHRA